MAASMPFDSAEVGFNLFDRIIDSLFDRESVFLKYM